MEFPGSGTEIIPIPVEDSHTRKNAIPIYPLGV
jgi:hypothetical protein